MEIFKLIVVILLATNALASAYFWGKSESGTIEELSYMVKAFGFAILLAAI